MNVAPVAKFHGTYAIPRERNVCCRVLVHISQRSTCNHVFFVAGMVSKLSVYGIQLKSRTLDIIPGVLIKSSMVRLMVDSDKALVFITPEYLDEDLCQFDLDMLQRRPARDLVVMTMGFDGSQLQRLPKFIADIVVDNGHQEYPTGACSGSDTNTNVFMLTLGNKLISNRSDSATVL